MGRATSKDAQALIHSLRSAYAATPSSLKVSFSLALFFVLFSFHHEVLKSTLFWCPDHRSVCGSCSFLCYNSGTACSDAVILSFSISLLFRCHGNVRILIFDSSTGSGDDEFDTG